jgi:hypothetical protein
LNIITPGSLHRTIRKRNDGRSWAKAPREARIAPIVAPISVGTLRQSRFCV